MRCRPGAQLVARAVRERKRAICGKPSVVSALSCAMRPSATMTETLGRAAMRARRKPQQVAISAGVGLFCGGTQRTEFEMMQSTSCSPSSGRAS